MQFQRKTLPILYKYKIFTTNKVSFRKDSIASEKGMNLSVKNNINKGLRWKV